MALAITLGPGSLPAADEAVIDSCQYADAAAAQAVWKPMGGTAPVMPVTLAGRKVLMMPCNFSGSRLERASWDRAVTLDLSGCRGVQFQFFCRDATPVSYFSLYFQSGDGWYHASFYPESGVDWSVITLDKSAFRSEGQPAGWGKIRTIRLSAWCAKSQDTELFLSDFRRTGVLGQDALVAILRADSAAKTQPSEVRSVEQFSAQMAEMLGAANIPSAILSDLDVTAEKLRAAKLVILPHNPAMPDAVADELVKYAATGRLLAFYTVPDKLRPVFGLRDGRHVKETRPGNFATIRFTPKALPGAPAKVSQRSWNISAYQPLAGQSRVLAEWLDDQGRPTGHAAIIGSSRGIFMTHVLLTDDAVNKRRMLLAMAGSLAPEIWQRAAANSLANLGAVNGFKNLTEATTGIGRLKSPKPAVKSLLTEATQAKTSAERALATAQYAEAMDQAAAANRKVLEAFCRAQSPQAGEFRAFWCHSAFGVQGMTWDAAVKQLADNGFTAILPNMLWGGVAYYPSQLLPTAREVAERGDQIALCLAACRKYGVQVHVWKVNWNLGHTVPKDFVEKLRQAGRLQADSKGKEEPWLCPSHPDNQKLEIESMLEVARNYAVDGIHFDYIRYPDNDHCFCAGCRERFEKALGKTLSQWPRDVLGNGPERQTWLEWRRGNITAVVKAVSEQARKIRPGITISAAVFPRWSTDRDGVAQDWKLWCERGYVDFVCPMDYTPHNAGFENLVAQQVQWAGRVPCYPGLGVSASSSRFGADKAIEQILITRRHKTGGFTIFNYGVPEATELLPLLGMGITEKRR